MSDPLKDLFNSKSWEANFKTLVNLGKKLNSLPKNECNQSNKIKSCASNVWIDCQKQNGRLLVRSNADSDLIKGLLALLESRYNGKTMNEASSINFMKILQDLNVLQHFSATRYNGLSNMVLTVRKFCSS